MTRVVDRHAAVAPDRLPAVFRRLAALALAVLTLSGPALADPYKMVTLPSGKQVKALSVVRLSFSQGAPALMLKYQTDLPIEDVPSLQKEADEIWASFRPDVERAGFATGILSATTEPKGFIITRSASYNFVYARDSSGRWSRVPAKGAEQ